MSEYQYYEFRAIDQRLSDREMDKLEDLSSRAEVTPTSFVNEYNYGDFRGDPVKIMDRYFDAFVYLANWGTRRLIFRLPRDLVDLSILRSYCRGDSLSLRLRKKHVLLEFLSNQEGFGGWEDGEGWMDRLIELREELLRGDLRCLFIAWLLRVQFEELNENQPVPPVPAGLGKPSPMQEDLMEFLRVDDQLVKASAKWSNAMSPGPSTKKHQAAWLAKIPEAQKNRYLLRLLEDDPMRIQAELRKSFQKKTSKPKSSSASNPRHTVGDLLALCPKD